MKFKRKIKRENKEVCMTQEELQKITNRIYELKNISEKALKEKNFEEVMKCAVELKKIEKKLKKSKKECEIREQS